MYHIGQKIAYKILSKKPVCGSISWCHNLFLDLEEIHRFIHVFKDLLSTYCVPGTRMGDRDRHEPLAREASRSIEKTDINP